MGVSRFDTVLANAFIGPGMVGSPFGVNFYVSNLTNPGEFQGSAGTTQQGRTPKNPFATIQAAIDEAVAGRGDSIFIQRGTYSEALTVNKAGLTLVGAVPYGYPDNIVVQGITTLDASNLMFLNLEFFSNDADSACVTHRANNTDRASWWFENCSFSSNGTIEPEWGLRVYGVTNLMVKNCFFIDLTRGFEFGVQAGGPSRPSNVVLDGCTFSENTTYHVGNGSAAAGDQQAENIVIRYCSFNRGVVTPTDYVNIAGGASVTGIMHDCAIAIATNASADIIVPSGLLYVSNRTEAGVTTARPS